MKEKSIFLILLFKILKERIQKKNRTTINLDHAISLLPPCMYITTKTDTRKNSEKSSLYIADKI